MLDDMTLAQKTQVAREWFRRSTTGAMPFNRNTAGTFLNLLEEIETSAARTLGELKDVSTRLEDLERAAARRLAPRPEAAAPHGGNVVRFRRKKGGAA